MYQKKVPMCTHTCAMVYLSFEREMVTKYPEVSQPQIQLNLLNKDFENFKCFVFFFSFLYSKVIPLARKPFSLTTLMVSLSEKRKNS